MYSNSSFDRNLRLVVGECGGAKSPSSEVALLAARAPDGAQEEQQEEPDVPADHLRPEGVLQIGRVLWELTNQAEDGLGECDAQRVHLVVVGVELREIFKRAP